MIGTGLKAIKYSAYVRGFLCGILSIFEIEFT